MRLKAVQRVVTLLLALLAAFYSGLYVSALSVKTTVGTVKLDIPAGYIALTPADVDQPEDFFNTLPISKLELQERVQSGVQIDAFSEEAQREIKVSVTSDAFSEQLVNFTPLSEGEQRQIIDQLKTGLTQDGHTFLAEPETVEIGDYTFIRYMARVGDVENGYSYMSVLTVLSGQYYEATCFNSGGILDQNAIDQNKQILNSLSITISGGSDIWGNALLTVGSILAILTAAGVIIYVGYTFIRQFLDRKLSQPRLPKQAERPTAVRHRRAGATAEQSDREQSDDKR